MFQLEKSCSQFFLKTQHGVQEVYFSIFPKDIMVLSNQVASPKRKHSVKPRCLLLNFLLNPTCFKPSSSHTLIFSYYSIKIRIFCIFYYIQMHTSGPYFPVFGHSFHACYCYHLKRQHSSNQVVYIAIFNQYNIFMTYTVVHTKYCRKRQQGLNQVGHYWIFLKGTTWFKPSSPSLDPSLMQYFSMISLTFVVNYYKYSRKRQQPSNQVDHYWVFSKKDDMFKTK